MLTDFIFPSQMWTIKKKNYGIIFAFLFLKNKSRANPFRLLEYANKKTIQTWHNNFVYTKITGFDSKSYSE